MPKAENSDVKKSIIRTTIKNENLLAKKMELNRIKKKGNKKLNSALKHKSERTSKLQGVLSTKIQQSIERAKYVQNARKSGWDKINKSIEVSNALVERAGVPSEQEQQQAEEDEYVKQFFADGPAEEKKEEKKEEKNGNIFALLDVEE